MYSNNRLAPLPLLKGVLLLFFSVTGSLNAQISVQLTPSHPTCFLRNDGAITAAVSGGVLPYTAVWSNGQTGMTITNLVAGAYQVTVTDAAGTAASAGITLTDPTPINTSFGLFNLICPGDLNGQIITTVTGGTAPYTFSWSNGASTQNLGNLAAGMYRLTVTDANGCIRLDSAQITSPNPLSISFSPAQPNVCNGLPASHLTAMASGGNAPYRFTWNTGVMGATIFSPPVGTYSVTVTDTLNCTHSQSITIGAFNSPSISISQQLSTCGDSPSTATAVIEAGTPPFAYQWNTGAASASIFLATNGLYAVTVTDGNGCTATASRQISLVQPMDISLTTMDVSCNGFSNGTATAIVSGGAGAPYNFMWSNGGNTATISGLSAGMYAVTVTDINGCTAQVATMIAQPPALTVLVSPPGNCQPALNATATGGMPAYTYLWSNGMTTPTIQQLTPGNFQVTVTDINGCSASGDYLLLPQTPLTATLSVQHVNCAGDLSGSISMMISGGQTPYRFSWSSGETSASLSGKPSGSYQVTITDDLGCSIIRSATINQPSPLQISTSEQDARCFATNTGSASVSVSGGLPPYLYEWSNGAADSFILNVSANIYTVTVTDAANCSVVASVTINQLPLVSVTITPQQPNCHGQLTGAASANPSGGLPAYTYQWSNGLTTPTITNLGPGIYIVTVTDANGCDAIGGVLLSAPPPITLSLTTEASTCLDDANGSIRATASGGQGLLSFLWSNGQSGNVISGLSPGYYQVTVTDNNGCSKSAAQELIPFPQPTCQLRLLNPVLMGNDAALNLDITSGTAPFSIRWNTGDTISLLSGLDTGTYAVTITDANGCRSVCHYQIVITGGIGNKVWLDSNKNGLQDSGEPGVPGVSVFAYTESGILSDSTTTDNNGRYLFNALVPGNYRLQFIPDSLYAFTLPNQGADEETDSDVILLSTGFTDLISVSAGNFITHIDAGIYLKPQLSPQPTCLCLNNATTADNGQFSLNIRLQSYAGESWRLINPTGLFELTSPPPPASPLLLSGQLSLNESGLGVYTGNVLTLHNTPYAGILTNGLDSIPLQGLCAYPAISMPSPPAGTICVLDDAIALNAVGSVPGAINYLLNNQAVTLINPADLPVGNYQLEARLIPQGDACQISFFADFTISDACLPVIAGRSWLDINYNGLIDAGEPGIPNVRVIISGQNFADSTLTNASGNYTFRVNPGAYRLRFALPPGSDLNATTPNVGSGANQRDSNIDPQTLMTPLITLARGQSSLQTDAGFVPPCINITNAGTIGTNYQFLCAPGNTPQPLVNVVSPSGGTASVPLEYIWMKSSVNSGFNSGFWELIPGTNTPEYSPGPLFETTYFARCVRRQNCGPFLETNIVVVEVGNVTQANFTGPNLICLGQTATFQALNTSPGATIQWTFGLGVTPITPTNTSSVTVRMSSIGTFNVTLSVTNAGCTAIKRGYVTVSNSNIFCNNGLLVGATVIENTQVQLNWLIPENEPYKSFKVLYSTDGLSYAELSEVELPVRIAGAQRHFEYIHETPKYGLNFYQIKMDNNSGNDIFSNIAEAIIYGDSRLVHVYPNPFSDRVTIELLEAYLTGVLIDVYAVNGTALQQSSIPPLTRKFELDLTDYPKGVYFIRLTYENVELKRLKVLKH